MERGKRVPPSGISSGPAEPAGRAEQSPDGDCQGTDRDTGPHCSPRFPIDGSGRIRHPAA